MFFSLLVLPLLEELREYPVPWVQLVALCHASDMGDMTLAPEMILVVDMMLAEECSNTVALADIGHNSVLLVVEHSTAVAGLAEIFRQAVLQVSKENGQIHEN
jgi:hypothetical protein